VRLPDVIERERGAIETYAREYGLDFFDVEFEVLDYDQLNEIASYGGFPTRYPHWRFGMEYQELAKSYTYGLAKIYELVINNNPVYAYLMKSNGPTEQKLVMAHVFGHADFFKNNLWFSKTNRRMIDEMANHATRVRSYIDRFGVETVEDFIDACLSLENLIDPHAEFIERRERRDWSVVPAEPEDAQPVPKLPSKSYMDSYINPPAFMEAQKAKMVERAQRKRKIPEEPQRDVLQFLMEHAPLENWERDILGIVRGEAYYFAPQGMTKIMNEGWACVGRDTLVFSDRGLVPMSDVVDAGPGTCVSDGRRRRLVYDRHVIRQHDTVTLKTRRGLKLLGSNNHRVLLADGKTWRRLDALAVGDQLAVSGGNGLWPRRAPVILWAAEPRKSLTDVAEEVGVSLWTVLRHRAGRTVRAASALAVALDDYEEFQVGSRLLRARRPIRVPRQMTEDLGAFLGYLVGDGHISRLKHHLGLTTGDREQALRFQRLGRALFGVPARMRLDGNRWRVLFHAESLSDLLVDGLGLTYGPSAREKTIPAMILRSPKDVMSAFLRALFDCDGHAGRQGVILSSSSARLSEQVQIVLLNYGILSRRRPHKDGCWHVHVTGQSARIFADEVGFGLTRKRAALQKYLRAHRWFKDEAWSDEVVGLERGRADVYDISVEETHRYAAAGFVNHNSYWHSSIMTQRALTDAEIVDFADHHAGTMAMGPGRINPYKIGIELFREIEDRWNKGKFGKEYEAVEDHEAKRKWDRKLGLGRQKIFEVRKIYNDVMFIDAFMDEEFCERLKLYTYGYDQRAGRYVVVDRDWRKVKQRLLFQLTNMGQPIIHVIESNYANRGELYLKHRFEGIPLDQEKARDTLKNLQRLWHRPVHIETTADDRSLLMSFDGSEHKQTWL
jgi:stage V sporulation protein R